MPSTPWRTDRCAPFLLWATIGFSTSAIAQTVHVADMEGAGSAAEAQAPAAPDAAPTPKAREAAAIEGSVGAALGLAREGARLYAQALAAAPDAQPVLFAEALARFDSIVRDHGETPMAQAVSDGRVGLIDIFALRALVAALEIPAAPSATATMASVPEETGTTKPPQIASPDVDIAVLFRDRASVAASLLCREPTAACHQRMVATAGAWFDALTHEASEAVARLVVAPPALDEAERVVADDAAARLRAFDEVMGARDGALAALAAELGDLFDQTVFASSVRRDGVIETDAGEVLAAAFMTVTVSTALDPNGRDAGGLSDVAAAMRSGFDEEKNLVFLWAASSFSQDLIRRSLGAGPVSQALAAQSARQQMKILAALGRGETVGAMFGAATPRALTPAEYDFLKALLSLDAATRASLILAAPQTPSDERVAAYAEWVSDHAHALSGRMLAADAHNTALRAGHP